MGLKQRIRLLVQGFNRKRKLKYILSLINENDSIIDIGVEAIKSIPQRFSTNYIEEYFLREKRNITCLGLQNDDFAFFRERYTNCELLLFDGKTFPAVKNGRYNIALSNAVIEHVGNYEAQKKWLEEISLISSKLVITTPNRYFPVETHTNILFLHWFPEKYRNKLFKIFCVSQKKVNCINELNLLSKNEFIKLLYLSGFSIIEIKINRILLFAMDFVIYAESKSNPY